MKKNFIALFCILLSVNFSAVAQTTSSEKKSSSGSNSASAGLPYDKGNWQFFIARQNMGYSNQKVKSGGKKLGNQSNLSLNVGINCFLIKSVAVGFESNVESYTSKSDASKNVNTYSMVFANFTYQTQLARNFNFFARAGVGYGGTTYKYTSYQTPTTDKEKSKNFGYKVQLGFPISFDHGGHTYLTPTLGYFFTKYKYDAVTDKDDRFVVGLSLESYLGSD